MVAMSNNNQDWYDEDEFDDIDDTNTDGKALVSKLRRAERAKDKRVKELEAELESLRKVQREANVTQVLSEKGVNPKIARFIPSDAANTPEEIDAWLEENGELFGVVAQSGKEKVTNEDLSALKQIDATTGSALSPDTVSDMMSAINNAQSQEELLALLLGSE
jgi:hypothetical protein